MVITVNGKEITLKPMMVAEFLSGTDWDPKRIAVERNGEIVPRASYASAMLCDGDRLEIVSFVGGG